MTNPIQDIKSNPKTFSIRAPSSSKPMLYKKVSEKTGVNYQKRMEELSEIIQEKLKVQDVKLNFSVDQSTGQVVVRVIDRDSGKVIWEIPPHELVALAREMRKLSGILYSNEI
jgi:flagellar protein FlaG